MTANEVDRALHAPIDTVAAALLALPEDQWFERKSSRVAPKDLAVAISAFANAEGGVVVVGLHDGGVEGVRGLSERMNGWRQARWITSTRQRGSRSTRWHAGCPTVPWSNCWV